MNRLFHAELELPVRGKSQRVTRRPNVAPGETAVLFSKPCVSKSQIIVVALFRSGSWPTGRRMTMPN